MRTKTLISFTAVLFALLFQGCATDDGPPHQKMEPSMAKNASPPIWAIAPAFQDALSFASGLAFVNSSSGSFFINTEGVPVMEVPFEHVEAAATNLVPMQNGLAVVYNEEGEKSLMLRNGLTITHAPANYNVHDPTSGREESLYPATDLNTRLKGYLNRQGLWYINPEFSDVMPFIDTSSVASQSDDLDYIVYDNGVVEAYRGEGTLVSIRNEIALFFQNGQYFFTNPDGVRLFDQQFDYARNYCEGFAAVERNELWGFIDLQGEWVVPPTFKWAADFKEGFALVENENGEKAIIDQEGAIVIPFEKEYSLLGEPNAGLCMIGIGETVGAVDTTGSWVISPIYDHILIFEHYAQLIKGDEIYIYFTQTGIVSEASYQYVKNLSEALIVVETPHASYLVNTQLGTVYESGFSRIPFYSEGLLLASELETGLWGYINDEAKWVIAPQFENARAFSCGLAAVKADGKWGYIANPLIYDEWISDEISRGAAAGLYEQSTSTIVSMDELLVSAARLIEKIEGREYSPEELIEVVGLGGTSLNRGVLQPSKEDAAVVAASLAKYFGANINCFFGFLSDEANVEPLKLSYVNYAVSLGLFDFEEPGVFHPQKPITREELYRLIVRLYEMCGIQHIWG